MSIYIYIYIYYTIVHLEMNTKSMPPGSCFIFHIPLGRKQRPHLEHAHNKGLQGPSAKH